MKIILLVCTLAAALQAQPTYTNVTDTLYTPVGGVLFTGTLQISSPVPAAGSNFSVAQWDQTIQVRNGVLNVRLIPNDTITPTGTSYVFHFVQSVTGAIWNQYCQIPTSLTPVKVKDVCTQVPYSPIPGSAAGGQLTGNWPNLFCPTCVIKTNNLSDLTSPSAARTNLGLAPIANSGSATDLTSGTIPAARLPASVVRNDQPNTFVSGSTLDLGLADSIRIKTGLLSAIPATCTVGQLYFASNATAGQQIYECSSTNVWTQQTGGSTGPCSGCLTATNNLSDLGSAATARTNLGLAAVASSGSATDLTTGTVAPARLPLPAVSTVGAVFSKAAVSHNFLTAINTDGTITAAQPSTTDIFGLATIASSGSASDLTAGTVPAARLPFPALASIGAIFSKAAVSHNFLTAINTDGTVSAAQPAATDVTGLAAIATSGSATDLITGTVPAARLPNPAPTTLGGVESKAAVSHQFLTAINTDGTVGQAQPTTGDISGLAAVASSGSATDLTAGTLPAGRLPSVVVRNDQANTFIAGSTMDMGSADSVRIKTGTVGALPATCTVGQIYFASNATAGQQIYECSATNTWTQQVGGGGTCPSCLLQTNNLSDLSSAATSRTNLGLAAIAASGSASDLTTGTVPAARLPNPAPTTLGGVESKAAASHNFLTAINTDGTVSAAQPAASDVSGLAAIATSGSATDLTTGTVPAARLPLPGAASLGGVDSKAAVSHNFLTAINTDGTVSAAQPATGDISGLAAVASSGSATDLTAGTLPAARLPGVVVRNDQANTFVSGSTMDMGNANSVRIKTGTVSGLPGTCTVGQLYFASDATAGRQIYECSATNTWTQQTGGGAFKGKEIYVTTDCGVVGDNSTDDTTALNTCIANAPDYSTLVIPFNTVIKVTAKINIHEKYGLRIRGELFNWNGPAMGTEAPAIIWYGADGGTVLEIINSENIGIEHFAIFSAPGYDTTDTGATNLIYIDQVTPTGPITTNITIDNMALLGIRHRVDFNAVYLSPTSQSNVEHITIRDSNIACSAFGQFGTGIHLKDSFNAIAHLYQHNTITYCYRGIYEQAGSGNIIDNQFNVNYIHMEVYPILPIEISRNDSENCNWGAAPTDHGGAWLIAGGVLDVHANRIANCNPGGGIAAVRWGLAKVKFSNNKFDPLNGPTMTGVPGTYVSSRENIYSTPSDPTTQTTALKTMSTWCSENDDIAPTWVSVGGVTCIKEFPADAASDMAVAGLGQMIYHPSYETFEIMQKGPSGNTPVWQQVVPWLGPSGGGLPNCQDSSHPTLGTFAFEDKSPSTFQWCGQIAGHWQWVQPDQALVVQKNIPTSTTTNNLVDIGVVNNQVQWATAFDIAVQAVGTAGANFRFKRYHFQSGYLETGGFFRVIPSTDLANGAGTDLNFDLEITVSGATSNTLRIRKTSGTLDGTYYVTIQRHDGMYTFTDSSTVATDSTPPTQMLQDTVVTQTNNTMIVTNAGGFKATIDPSSLASNINLKLPTSAGTFGLSARNYGGSFGTPGGAALSTGLIAYTQPVPVACTIAGFDILSDGTATVKFWKLAAGTALPTSSNSINTSGVSISTGSVIHSTTISDFTSTAVAANDVIAVTLTAVSAGWVQSTLRCQ